MYIGDEFFFSVFERALVVLKVAPNKRTLRGELSLTFSTRHKVLFTQNAAFTAAFCVCKVLLDANFVFIGVRSVQEAFDDRVLGFLFGESEAH